MKDGTELADRWLSHDGISLIDPDQVLLFLRRGLKPRELKVTELTPELEYFNLNVPPSEQLLTERQEQKLSYEWMLPEPYLKLDVEQHVLRTFEARLLQLNYTDAQLEAAINRVALELEEYRSRGLFNLLRVIIFILDRFKEANQIYGVGRGSSCASYILFLLDLHVVDSIKFSVPLEEFFHD